MTFTREFSHSDDSGDTAYFTHTTFTDDIAGEDQFTTADQHITVRTRGGRPVYLPMRVARELAGWLIEHAAEPTPSPICGAVNVNGWLCVVATGQTHGWHQAGDEDGTCWKNE